MFSISLFCLDKIYNDGVKFNYSLNTDSAPEMDKLVMVSDPF